MNIYTKENIVFMERLKDYTVQSITTSKIGMLDKLKFIKLGGQKFFEGLNRYQKLTEIDKLKHHFFNGLNDKDAHLIDVIETYFDKTSESLVRRSMIQIVGIESSGKSGKNLREQILIKHESYQKYFVFNIVYDIGNIDMLYSSVERENTYSVLIRTEGYPTKEQLILMIATPQKLETVKYNNDFGTFKAFKTDFNVNNINLYKTN